MWTKENRRCSSAVRHAPPFCQLQSRNPKTEYSETTLKEGVEHMKFVVKLYKKQVDQGRLFLHEQPAHAMSWIIPEVNIMMMMESGSRWWKQTSACTV